MKPIFYIYILLFSVLANAQIDSLTVRDIESDSIYKISLKDLVVGLEEEVSVFDSIGWLHRNRMGFDFSEVTFLNWNSGGTNSVSGLFYAEFERNFKKRYTVWDNRLMAKIGASNQDKVGFRKTDDAINITSTFGYRTDTISNWYTSASLSFKTQILRGFEYKDDNVKKISNLMAPGYLFLGVGTIYSDDVRPFTVYVSPLTLKYTFVLDQSLANSGSFGVKPAIYDSDGNLVKEGKRLRRELGMLISNTYEKEIYKNIVLRNIVGFYSDYLNGFGNIDVDWEVLFDFKVNDYIRASFSSHIKYDDDIRETEIINGEEVLISGPRVQWKQALGIGVVYDF